MADAHKNRTDAFLRPQHDANLFITILKRRRCAGS